MTFAVQEADGVCDEERGAHIAGCSAEELTTTDCSLAAHKAFRQGIGALTPRERAALGNLVSRGRTFPAALPGRPSSARAAGHQRLCARATASSTNRRLEKRGQLQDSHNVPFRDLKGNPIVPRSAAMLTRWLPQQARWQDRCRPGEAIARFRGSDSHFTESRTDSPPARDDTLWVSPRLGEGFDEGSCAYWALSRRMEEKRAAPAIPPADSKWLGKRVGWATTSPRGVSSAGGIRFPGGGQDATDEDEVAPTPTPPGCKWLGKCVGWTAVSPRSRPSSAGGVRFPGSQATDDECKTDAGEVAPPLIPPADCHWQGKNVGWMPGSQKTGVSSAGGVRFPGSQKTDGEGKEDCGTPLTPAPDSHWGGKNVGWVHDSPRKRAASPGEPATKPDGS